MSPKKMKLADLEKMAWDLNDTLREHKIRMDNLDDRVGAIESSHVNMGRLELLSDMIIKRQEETIALLKLPPKPKKWFQR